MPSWGVVVVVVGIEELRSSNSPLLGALDFSVPMILGSVLQAEDADVATCNQSRIPNQKVQSAFYWN